MPLSSPVLREAALSFAQAFGKAADYLRKLGGFERETGGAQSAGAQLADQVLDGLPVPLLLLDRQRRVVRMNRAAGEAVGKAGLGRDLTATLRHPALVQAVDAVLAGDAAREIEFSLAVPVERHFAAHVGRVGGGLPDA
ncbi:MAG: hypothetical protein ACT4N4_06915, partial [Rhodospirillales bacterium]